MVPYKRVDLVVEAFSNMKNRKLKVVGNGPELAKIKMNASSNIEFLGYKEDEDLKALMQQAKAFVFAAEEDFGITVVEAMACGTPVLATPVGAVPYIIKNCETGFLLQSNDPQYIADNIVSCILL